MEKVYGYEPEKWEEAKKEVREILERRVREGKDKNDIVIFYKDLAQQLKSIGIGCHEARFAHLLGEVSRATEADYGVMLSVIVVGHCNSVSGPGFFRLARHELGRTQKDDIILWVEEFEKVLKHYRQ